MMKQWERKDVDNITPSMEWISVKDRLPEPGFYLCYYRYQRTILNYNGKIFKNLANGQVITSVTHWNTMIVPPLPSV